MALHTRVTCPDSCSLSDREVLRNNNYRNASFGSHQKPSNALHPIELTQLWAAP
jgi:hypothetical protein